MRGFAQYANVNRAWAGLTPAERIQAFWSLLIIATGIILYCVDAYFQRYKTCLCYLYIIIVLYYIILCYLYIYLPPPNYNTRAFIGVGVTGVRPVQFRSFHKPQVGGAHTPWGLSATVQLGPALSQLCHSAPGASPVSARMSQTTAKCLT